MTLIGIILFFGGLGSALFMGMFPVRWKLINHDLPVSRKDQGFFFTGAAMREDIETLAHHLSTDHNAYWLLKMYILSLAVAAIGFFLLVLDSLLSK